MAVPTVTISSVETQDAAGFTAPYRLSKIATKDEVALNAQIASAAGKPVRCVQWRLGGNRKTGKILRVQGAVCGIHRCGYQPPRSTGSSPPYPRVGPLSRDVGVVDVGLGYWNRNYLDTDLGSELNSGEGNYTIYCDALNADGWST